MQLFISWSGWLSQGLALALREWTPQVIQQIDPFVSSEDIHKGSHWNAELFGSLDATSQGIVAVTRENQHRPWLNFEAGALGKSLGPSSVRPVLLDLEPAEVTGPLSAFQATSARDKSDMLKLMHSLNSACTSPLEPEFLARSFDRVWNDFLKAISNLSVPEDEPTPRSHTDLLSEILELVRGFSRSDNIYVEKGPVILRENPLDSLSFPTLEAQEDWLGRPLLEGDAVLHRTFGLGRVVSTEGLGELRVVAADFAREGTKRLLVSYAPLLVVSPLLTEK